MADITIDQLTNTTPTTSSILPISKDGVTQSTTLAQLSSLPFIPKSFAVFDGSNAINTDCIILKSFNVSKVQKLGWVGLYQVTFSTPVDWPYVPVVGAFNNGTGDGGWNAVGYYSSSYPTQGQDPTNSGFTIQCYTYNGNYQSQKFVSFHVF